MRALDRRTFLLGAGAIVACRGAHESTPSVDAPPAGSPPSSSVASSLIAPPSRPFDPLLDAFPALARALPRVVLGAYPSAIERASKLAGDRALYVKRDDDFTGIDPHAPAHVALFGGNKVRKLERFFGDAIARGAREIVTFGGVGSNQAIAVALFAKALGLSARLYLAPQPRSSLVAKNLAADAASGATMRLFDSVVAAEAEASREAAGDPRLYRIPAGGTTPLGTLGFVAAAMELAHDVRAGKLPAPKKIYVALGLGGTAVGLAIGCAIAGLHTTVAAVRVSNPHTVDDARLRAIHDETIAFARARDAGFPSIAFGDTAIAIEGRYLGAGYGAPTKSGDAAVARADEREGWELDPVYTGKALAAALDDRASPALFWNTASSRPLPSAPVPAPFAHFVG